MSNNQCSPTGRLAPSRTMRSTRQPNEIVLISTNPSSPSPSVPTPRPCYHAMPRPSKWATLAGGVIAEGEEENRVLLNLPLWSSPHSVLTHPAPTLHHRSTSPTRAPSCCASRRPGACCGEASWPLSKTVSEQRHQDPPNHPSSCSSFASLRPMRLFAALRPGLPCVCMNGGIRVLIYSIAGYVYVGHLGRLRDASPLHHHPCAPLPPPSLLSCSSTT